jgi:hypothetical protein
VLLSLPEIFVSRCSVVSGEHQPALADDDRGHLSRVFARIAANQDQGSQPGGSQVLLVELAQIGQPPQAQV